jgi:hypothetical protein
MRKLIFMLPLALIALSGCGRGGGGGAVASNSGASTSAISSYMSKEYSTEQISFRANLQALENIEASKDIECTEHELTAVVNLKKTQVQTFLNAVIAFIQAEKSNNQIDKAAIAPLFAGYQTKDVGWLASTDLIPACEYTPEMVSASGYAKAIDSSYASANSQLNAM